MRIVKNVAKRTLSLLLAVMMVVSMMPQLATTAQAAVSGDVVTGLAASGDNAWTMSGNTITGAVTSTAKTDKCGNVTGYTTKSSTLTLTNNSGAAKMLSFSWGLANGGSVTIGGTASAATGAYNAEFAAGAKLEIKITSHGSNTDATTLNLSGIALADKGKKYDITFVSGTNGTYTVNGEKITATKTETQVEHGTKYTLEATPSSGYKVRHWEDGAGNILSTANTYEMILSETITIKPVFIKADTAMFGVGDKTFYDLNEANAYASSQEVKQINLLNNGVLYGGKYTISSGNTLLIPFDSAYTCYKEEPESTGSSFLGASVTEEYTAPSLYRKLTMANGAHIAVNGAISVSAKNAAGISTGAAESNKCGAVTGKYGQIQMNSGSTITVNNGGAFYAWGYVTGDGSVTANSGAKVYELMQVTEFRGGTILKDLAANPDKTGNVFPLSQYYVQNIEVLLTLHAGATEYGYTAILAKGMGKQSSTAQFIGPQGMFRLNSGYVTKYYNRSTDRLHLDIYGDVTLGQLSMGIGDVKIDSSKFVLPITNNVTITAHSGKVSLNQKVALLPGVEVYVNQGAELEIATGMEAFVYAATEWNGKKFVHGGQNIAPVTYVPGGRANRTTTPADCIVDVNGKATVNGDLYTTASGARIISSKGTGEIHFANNPGKKTTTYQYQYPGNGVTGVTVTPAKLLNGDGKTYVATQGNAAAGDFYLYDKNAKAWYMDVTVSYVANGGRGELAEFEDNEGNLYENETTFKASNQNIDGGFDCFPLPEFDGFVKPGYKATSWNTKSDNTGEGYYPGDVYTIYPNDKANIKFYAQWVENIVNVTLKDEDGNLLTETPISGQAGTELILKNVVQNLPAADTGYSLKWKNEADESAKAIDLTVFPEEDTTYIAAFEPISYTIAYELDGGALPDGQNNPEKYTVESPNIDVVNPEKTGHTFVGWTGTGLTEPTKTLGIATGNTGDRSYTATWKVIEYTVDYVVDGNIVETVKVPYGSAIPAYDYIPAEGYTFSGWNTDIPDEMPAKNLTFTGTTSLNSYEVSFAGEGVKSNGAALVNHGAAYSATLELTETQCRKLEKDNITVTIGGKTYAGFAYEDGTLTIPGEAVTGAVAIKAVAQISHTPKTAVEENRKEPTCAEAGSYDSVVYCSACDAEISRTNQTIAATGTHNYIEEVSGTRKEPTCSMNGSVTMKCDKCNATESAILPVVADAHSWNEGKITTPATCNAVGEKTYTCVHNSGHTKTEAVAIDGEAHSWDDGKITTPATCIAEGEKTYTCKHNSGHTKTEAVAIDGEAHSWDDGKITTPATCTAEGEKTYTCKHNSGHTKTEAVAIDANVHSSNEFIYESNGETHKKIHKCCEVVADAAEPHSFDSTDGLCDKCEANLAVASVGIGKALTYFETLQAAIDAAEAGTKENPATVTILKDISMEFGKIDQYRYPSYAVLIETGVMIIDLNGKTVESTGSHSAVKIKADTSCGVTIMDNKEGGKITNHGIADEPWSSAIDIVSGTLTIAGGTIEDKKCWGVGLGDSAAVVNVIDGTIRGQITGIVVDPGHLEISGGNISGTRAVSNGAGTIEISGGTITGTDIGLYNGNGIVNITGGNISGKNADLSGCAKFSLVDCSLILGVGDDGIGATFADGLTTELEWYEDGAAEAVADVSRILADGVSYWAGETMLVDIADDATEITGKGAITVKTTASYNATFDANGGAWPDGETTKTVESVMYGKPISKPENPSREHYNFAGWDPNVGNMDDIKGKTFTAKWTEITHTVTFHANNGTEESTTQTIGEVTTSALSANTFTKTGHTFAGWATSPDGEKVYTDGDKITVSANTDLYAVWTVNKYTIKFVNENGTELQSSEVAYGEKPEYKGKTPTKAATAQYTYTFAGWTPEIETVTGEATYTATYSSTVNEYTVKFVDEDDTELQSGKVAYGETPAYTGATPTKAATAQYTYTFAGWTPEIVEVTGEATYKATYSSTVNEYIVKFVDEDGTELQSSKVAYGEKPEYKGKTPTKAATAQYTYSFAGWDSEIKEVAGEATYKATYSSTVNEYIVKFVDEDGTELQSSKVAYGEKPEYKEETPTKTATAQYTYTFAGWDPEIKAVTGEATYTAIYDSSVNEYTVTWIIDGKQTVKTYAYGAAITAPVATKAQEGCTTYTFSKWSDTVPDTMPGTNLTFTAEFTEGESHDWKTEIGYDWKQVDGQWTCTANRVCSRDASHVETENATVSGKVTQKATCVAMGQTTYTATFTEAWAKTQTEVETDVPVDSSNHTGGTEIRDAKAATVDQNGYSGDTWCKGCKTKIADGAVIPKIQTKIDVDNDYQDQEIPASLKQNTEFDTVEKIKTGLKSVVTQQGISEEHTVLYDATLMHSTDEGKTWAPATKDHFPADGNLEVTLPVPAGTSISTHDYFVVHMFTTSDFGKTVGDTEVIPASEIQEITVDGEEFLKFHVTGLSPMMVGFEQETHTVTFHANSGNGEMESQTIGELVGSALTANAFTKEGHSFQGWSEDAKATSATYCNGQNITVTEDKDLYAVWKINQYTIRFNTDGGSEVDSITQNFGTAVMAPAAPTKTGYTFAGWEPAVPTTMPADNMLVKAKWTAKTYNAVFNANGGKWGDGTNSKTVATVFDTAIQSPAEPAKEGHTFNGWAPAVGNMTEEGMTFTAQWTPKTYTVTWNVDGQIYTTTKATFGQAIAEPATNPSKTGYTFTGWANVPETMPAQENLTIEATWTKTQYTITYTGVEDVGNNPGGYDVEDLPLILKDVVKAEYVFTGWTCEALGTTKPAKGLEIPVGTTGNLTFQANFEKAYASLTSNGNTTYFATMAEAVAAAKDGDAVHLLADATGTGMVIDKSITVDFGGNKYTVNNAIGSAGTETLGFQLVEGNTITLKNGELAADPEATNVQGKVVKMLVQNYADLTMEGMTLTADKNTLYSLSINSGNVKLENCTINSALGKVAFDVCKYASYNAPTVTATNCTVTGVVEVTGGNLTVNGGTYTSNETDVFVVDSGKLTINGNPDVTGGSKDGSTAVWAKNTGHVVINGGNYNVGADESAAQGYNDLIYARDNAVIEINGGTFDGPARDGDGQKFLLNLKDNSSASITVKGGKFIGFDPQNSGTEPVNANNDFTADGFIAVKDDEGNYTVKKHSHAYTYSADGTVITESCHSGCRHSATATLVKDAEASLVYTGSAITPYSVQYSESWQGGNLTVTYNNNWVAGQATATITKGGASVSEQFTITQAIPEYVAPENLIGELDKTLADVTLPTGWAWVDPTTVITECGEQTHKAIYTPTDKNYKAVTVDVILTALLYGDVDLDKDVDAYDMTLLAQHVGGVVYLTDPTALKNADVDQNGIINAYDLTRHACYVGGVIVDWKAPIGGNEA